MAREMNARQKRFCELYAAEPIGAKAARDAGYTHTAARVKASKLLTKPNIKAYIAELREELSITTNTSAEWHRAKLRELIDKCAEPIPVMIYDAELKELVHNGDYKYDSAGALKGMDQLAKMNGHYAPEKVDHGGEVVIRRVINLNPTKKAK